MNIIQRTIRDTVLLARKDPALLPEYVGAHILAVIFLLILSPIWLGIFLFILLEKPAKWLGTAFVFPAGLLLMAYDAWTKRIRRIYRARKEERGL